MTSRLKLDENLPDDAAALMRQVGFDVETALSEEFGGAPDPALLQASVNEGRVFVTLDLDFSDIRTYPPPSHEGIWVLRPQRQGVQQVLQLLGGALRMPESESAEHRLWILEHDRIRIRE